MFLLLLLLLDPVSVKATRVTCVVVRFPDMSVGEPDYLSRNGFPAWLNEWTPQFHNPQAPSSPNSIKRWTSKANSVAQHYVHPFHVNSMKMHICTWSSPPLTWLGAPSASHPPKPFGSVRLNIYPFASPHVHCRKAETYISPHVQYPTIILAHPLPMYSFMFAHFIGEKTIFNPVHGSAHSDHVHTSIFTSWSGTTLFYGE